MTDRPADPPEIVDVPERQRFEARLDGEVVGFATYRRSDGIVTLPHTEVPPQHEGKGVGTALAKAALDDARERGEHVVPSCPFIATYVERHPEYADLVKDRHR